MCGHLQGNCLAALRVHGAGRIVGIRNLHERIELTGTHTYDEHVHQRTVHIGLGDETLLKCTQGVTLVNASAIRVHTGPKTCGSSLLGSFHIVMSGIDILNGGAVTCHITFHAVGAACYGIQIECAGRCRHMVHRIV